MLQPISITAIASLSPLGNNPKSIWEHYCNSNHCFVQQDFGNSVALTAPLDQDSKELLIALRKSDNKYKFLDDSVLMAIAASRLAIAQAGWKKGDEFGVNIGSSRGATSLFEKHHIEFLKTGKAPTLASPTTTLGNISSWVAHDLQSNGPEISHSITSLLFYSSYILFSGNFSQSSKINFSSSLELKASFGITE